MFKIAPDLVLKAEWPPDVRLQSAECSAQGKVYRALFRLNPCPMWIFEEDTLRFLDVNEAAVKFYGWSRQEFLRMTVKDVCPPEEVRKLRKNPVIQRHARGSLFGEWRHWRKDHTLLDVEVRSSCIQFQGREARLAMVNDITERKRDEESLRESEMRYRRLFNNDLTGDFTATPDGTILLCNPAFADIFGFATVKAAVGTNLAALCSPEDPWPALVKMLRHRKRLERHERNARRCDGRPLQIVETVVGTSNHRGDLVQIEGYVFDDTEYKQAGVALRQGKALSDALNQISVELHSTLNSGEIIQRLISAGALTLGSNTAAVSLREDGGWRVSYVHGMPARYAGLRLEDGTERHALLAIKSREPVAVADAFNDNRFNRAHMRRHNIQAVLVTPLIVRDKPLGAIFFNYHGGPHAFTETEVSFARYLASTAAIALENARLFDERKQAEAALRISEERLALAASGTRIGMFEWNIATGKRVWNEQFARLLGLRITKASTTLSLAGHYRDWARRVHPEDLPRVEAELRRCMAERAPYEAEYRVVWPDKSVHWVVSRGVFQYDAKGRPERMLGIIMDISVRKKAEEELKKLTTTLEQRVAERTADLADAYDRLRAITDSALVGILTLDAWGRIETVNPAAMTIFGYLPSEMIGRKISELITSPHQVQGEYFLAHYTQPNNRHFMGTGREVLGRRKDGHVMMLELTVSDFTHRGRREFVAMVRDITRRKRLQRELLEAGERERQRLGHDLHDGLGQHLHALYYMAELLEKETKEISPKWAQEAGRLSRQLEHALELSRGLARGLQPVNAVPEGLMVALRELAGRTHELYRIACRFECRAPVLIHRHSAANHLYRIAQEAVNNAMKHGKPTLVRIKLTASPQRIVLGIHDNGVGIRQRAGRAHGMGLYTMQYRADALRGLLVVQRRPKGGTEVVCTITRQALLAQEESPK